MPDALQTLESMVGAALAQRQHPTPEDIRDLIAALRKTPMCSDVDDDAAEALARLFEMRHGVTMAIGGVLTGPGYKPWLEGARPQITPYYWDRYKKLLGEKALSGQVIATLDSVTDRVLGLLENPAKTRPWHRRGMVMGHVQSGKTANYIGLICKAADAGYKLIVVIAGIHNVLRNQTQLRIDEGFVGRDSARLLSKKGDFFVGVGRYDQTRRPVTFTNSMRDFNKTMATGVGVALQNLNEPVVFVIKKNSNTLKNLLEWLKEYSAKGGGRTIDEPMLLIDDEADNASINVSHGNNEVSKINGQIRDLLQTFDRSCYVGYTATPFANIFIDPDSDDEMLGDDLFPRDFIVSLDPPSNYFGAQKVFIDEPDAIVRHVDDAEEFLPLKHKIHFTIGTLPPSLVTAIRTFIVGRAIRLSRGQVNQHSSMLVNASRFTNVQTQIRNEVHQQLGAIQSSIRINGALKLQAALKDPEIEALYQVWLTEFGEDTDWHKIQPLLLEAAAPITVVEVNSRASGTLNYGDHSDTGLSVIAVGGYSLSRGLTLEGLMVSYFLRNSMMYDTLMQMGRWFGYRAGYEDLCRVWMPEEAEGWYAHIAESIEMLRAELRMMETASATPEQFGLKVRSHPDTLIVTARNKMGSGQTVVWSVGLSNKFIETSTLRRDEKTLKSNRLAVSRLVDSLVACGHPVSGASVAPTGWLLPEVPVAPILEFITQFQNHPASVLTDPVPVRRYIEEREESELAVWDVLFTSLSRPEEDTLVDESLGLTINCQLRSAGDQSKLDTLRITNKQRVASRGVERTGLTDEQIAMAEEAYRLEIEAEGRLSPDATTVNYPDRIYRLRRERPLLIVHMLKIKSEDGGPVHSDPVVAYSISFPDTKTEETRVQYVVNTVWLREFFPEEFAEEEMQGDDE